MSHRRGSARCPERRRAGRAGPAGRTVLTVRGGIPRRDPAAGSGGGRARLGAADLGRSVAFYRDGLGWPTEDIVDQEFHDDATGADGTTAIFTLGGGLLLPAE
jgi:hypothetical protein